MKQIKQKLTILKIWKNDRSFSIHSAPDWFDFHDEFIVGDGRTYGPYLNHGPLASGRDYHVTVGTVSEFQGVTKVNYAQVSHAQHQEENILVFRFHDHGDHGECSDVYGLAIFL